VFSRKTSLKAPVPYCLFGGGGVPRRRDLLIQTVSKKQGIPDETRGCVGGARARSIAPGESVVSACRALFGRGEIPHKWIRIHSESGKLVLILDE
jgi:hypothetical protein